MNTMVNTINKYKHLYTSSEKCAERLFEQWKLHPSLIIAVDFDDTLKPFKEDFDTSEVLDILKQCNELGFRIVIYTASRKDRFPYIEGCLYEMGVEYEGINKNLLDKVGNDGKIYYNLLLCDRAGLGQALETLEILLEKIKNNIKQ